ncbi:glycosyltransferase [Marivirga arenosa]|uniref:Glycosyltransferase n=1 Tax=Marivirga arenosa TaxID=3059076 RepID=A0AA51N7V6_9BACT|nr:glycosyltransferase [Marivirga sp. ABR2-2]WMN07698.1 glycosyltransferase [Marivirga sp. ABR2-2]
MKIALIAHDFPPYNVGGSQRPYYMAKSLVEAGIDVVVFTLNTNSYPNNKLNFHIDESSLKIVRTKIQPEKTSIFSKGHYLKLTDDVASRWIPHLITAINYQHQESSFDYLIITCPPFSLSARAQKLSEKTGIPYILDFRDAWSQWVMTPYPSYLHYRRVLQIEKKAIDKAVFVTSTSLQQVNDFAKIHGHYLRGKFIYSPNGFEEYQENTKANSNNNCIRIAYTGSFYFNPYSQSLQSKKWYQKKWYQWLQYLPRIEDWSYRSPLYFFKTLRRVLKKNQYLSSRVQVVFAGQKPDWFDEMVKNYCLQEVVQHIGFINKVEVQDLINQADYLLITSSKIPDGKEYSVAGKTFEYIANQKTILAFVNEGEQKDVLRKTGLAYMFNPDNIEENVLKMESLLKSKTKLDSNKEGCNQFKTPNNYANLIFKLKNL